LVCGTEETGFPVLDNNAQRLRKIGEKVMVLYWWCWKYCGLENLWTKAVKLSCTEHFL